VKELLTNYGPGVPAILWWDTPVSMTPERAEQFLPLLLSKPGIVMNNRLDSKKLTGDFQTPEQKIPPTGIPGEDWETCMTINGTWGYKSFDHNFKSTETLLHNLIDIASKGGNYLLNVGPTSTGVIPQPEVERLRQIGEWMKVNGQAIYGTSASPFKEQLPWGRCTQKPTPPVMPLLSPRAASAELHRSMPEAGTSGTTLYLHVWDWPADGKLLVPGLKNKIVDAYVLKRSFFGWHKRLATANGPRGVTVTVPKDAPDKISSTVVLQINGKPEID
jgi:alpha-L-fucosidase